MAGDRQRYETALDVWQNHRADENFSEPSETGGLAILVPYDTSRYADHQPTERISALTKEASQLADYALEQGKVVDVAINAGPVDFERALKDTFISDIILIGHGCLASFEVVN